MTLELTVGDTAPTITGTVNAILTGATLEAHIKRSDGTVIERTATAANPTAGTWTASLQAGDLTVSGTYHVELEVTYSGGAIQTFAKNGNTPATFTVRQQYA